MSSELTVARLRDQMLELVSDISFGPCRPLENASEFSPSSYVVSKAWFKTIPVWPDPNEDDRLTPPV